MPVPQSPFLDAGEYQRFTQDYHQFPRHIERVNDAAGAAPRKPQHREVDEFAAQQLRELLRFKNARFAGLAVAVQQAVSNKVPRNAPCPCGSSKKYKQCHGRTGAVGA